MPTKPTFNALKRANAQESYEWLSGASPVHLEAVQEAMNEGATPDDVYRFMLADTQRPEIAHRCRLAARWMIEVSAPDPADWAAANRMVER